jgi:2-methylisocitrate lyase-like PEP mutase family enzyme
MATERYTTAAERQARFAEARLALHHGPDLLVIPNGWDVISARLFEIEGFAAVATTSAGVAASLGYPDGQRMSLDENLAVARRIAECVNVPLSADLEAGYGTRLDDAVHACRQAVAAGIAGVNLEDGTGDPQRPLVDLPLQVEKLKAVRQALLADGTRLVLNARTDSYLLPGLDAATRFRETVRRGQAYRAAGADCVFVPDMSLLDESVIGELVREIVAPLNLIAGAHLPPLKRLRELGVARVSIGPRASRATLGLVRRIARELRSTGTYAAMSEGALTYAEVNQMLERRDRVP